MFVTDGDPNRHPDLRHGSDSTSSRRPAPTRRSIAANFAVARRQGHRRTGRQHGELERLGGPPEAGRRQRNWNGTSADQPRQRGDRRPLHPRQRRRLRRSSATCSRPISAAECGGTVTVQKRIATAAATSSLSTNRGATRPTPVCRSSIRPRTRDHVRLPVRRERHQRRSRSSSSHAGYVLVRVDCTCGGRPRRGSEGERPRRRPVSSSRSTPTKPCRARSSRGARDGRIVAARLACMPSAESTDDEGAVLLLALVLVLVGGMIVGALVELRRGRSCEHCRVARAARRGSRRSSRRSAWRRPCNEWSGRASASHDVDTTRSTASPSRSRARRRRCTRPAAAARRDLDIEHRQPRTSRVAPAGFAKEVDGGSSSTPGCSRDTGDLVKNSNIAMSSYVGANPLLAATGPSVAGPTSANGCAHRPVAVGVTFAGESGTHTTDVTTPWWNRRRSCRRWPASTRCCRSSRRTTRAGALATIGPATSTTRAATSSAPLVLSGGNTTSPPASTTSNDRCRSPTAPTS